MKEPMKLIKVTNRCQVLTSRGMCTGPILYPFYEKVSYILPMFGKGAQVVEVMDNGVEVPLSVYNFDKVNTKREVKTHNVVKQPEPIKVQASTPKQEETTQVEEATVIGKGQDVIFEKNINGNNNQNKNQNNNNFKQNKQKNKNQNNNNQQHKNHVKLDTTKEQKTNEDFVEEV